MTIAIETRPFGFTTAAQQFGLMASRALDPTPVFEEILREFPQVASQAFGGSPDLIDTGQMHGAWMAPMHSFSADVLSIGVDEEHSHF